MLRSLYGKITSFPKKEKAFQRWRDGQTFAEISRTANVAEATTQIYVIDMIAKGFGNDQHGRLIREMEILKESFEEVSEMCSRSGVTLREIKDSCSTQISYNQIRAIIALFVNGYEL